MSDFRDVDSISVVMATYNAAAWIRGALDSVLAQTHPAEEVIVVDDGSTDETIAISRTYGAKVRLIEEEHRGRPHRNRGIQASHGSFVAFIDADDLWRPMKLERQVAKLKEFQAKWVACGADWFDLSSGRPVPGHEETLFPGDILENLFLHNYIVASTAVVSRRVLDDVGGFNESAEVAPVEDWDLWLRIAARYPLAIVPDRLAAVGLHEDSFLASTPLRDRVQSLERVINAAVSREPVRLEGKRNLALHNVYFGAGVTSFRRGFRREARRYFNQAWRYDHGDLMSLVYVVLSWFAPSLSGLALQLKRRLTRKR